MKRKNITKKDVDELWEKLGSGTNEFVLALYPTKEDYWKEYQRINNLPDDEWQALIKRNLAKVKEMQKPNK